MHKFDAWGSSQKLVLKTNEETDSGAYGEKNPHESTLPKNRNTMN